MSASHCDFHYTLVDEPKVRSFFHEAPVGRKARKDFARGQLTVNFAIGRMSVAGRDRTAHQMQAGVAPTDRCGLIAVVGVVLVIPPVRVPQHPLPDCEPTSLGLDGETPQVLHLGAS